MLILFGTVTEILLSVTKVNSVNWHTNVCMELPTVQGISATIFSVYERLGR